MPRVQLAAFAMRRVQLAAFAMLLVSTAADARGQDDVVPTDEEAPIGVQLYVGSCAEAIDPELLALVRDELTTSGFAVDASTAELHVAVAPACRGREARVTVTDPSGRLLESRELAVGGLLMSSRVIALGTAELLREVVRSVPAWAERDAAAAARAEAAARELAATRAALDQERATLEALREERAAERERAARLAGEHQRLVGEARARVEAKERERAAREARRARTLVRARIGLTVFDGAWAGGGELGVDVGLSRDWTLGVWLGGLGTRTTTPLGTVPQVALDVGTELFFWLKLPRAFELFAGPSVAVGASLVWGQPDREGIASGIGSGVRVALAAAGGVRRVLGAWTVGVGLRGGYTLGGVEAIVDGQPTSGLRGVFLSVGLDVGWAFQRARSRQVAAPRAHRRSHPGQSWSPRPRSGGVRRFCAPCATGAGVALVRGGGVATRAMLSCWVPRRGRVEGASRTSR